MTQRPAEGRRTGAKALATRAALVDLAAEMFAEDGYIQTSIRDIARRSGLTSGAIYGNFRNKADLLVEAINMRTAAELEASGMGSDAETHVETLGRLSAQYRKRRRLRALIVEGAAAAHTDAETRDSLRQEQLSHLNRWIAGYEEARERLGIDPSVDLQAAVLYTWAAEVGLGVLEAVGIEPTSAEGWADAAARFGRALMLPRISDGRMVPTSSRRPRGAR